MRFYLIQYTTRRLAKVQEARLNTLRFLVAFKFVPGLNLHTQTEYCTASTQRLLHVANDHYLSARRLLS
jgi:hypothetical protein